MDPVFHQNHIIKADWLTDFFDKRSIKHDDLAVIAGVSPEALFDSQGKMLESIYYKLCCWAAEHFNIPHLGLYMVDKHDSSQFGILGFFYTCAKNLENYCELIERYHRIISSGSSFQFIDDGECIEARFTVKHHDKEMTAHGVEFALSAKVVLARQEAKSIVKLCLHDFIDDELIVRNGAEMSSAALHDLGANFATRRQVPKDHAAVQKIARVSLPQNVTAAAVLRCGCYCAGPDDLRESRQPLQTQHIVRIDDQRVFHVQCIDQLVPPEIDLAQRVREIRNRIDAVIRDSRKLPLREFLPDDECVQRNAFVLRKARERVVQMFGGAPERNGHDGGSRGTHRERLMAWAPVGSSGGFSTCAFAGVPPRF